MLEITILLFSGILGGVLAGLLGIGGGIVFLFILSFALPNIGVPAEELVQYQLANSILGVFFATLSANISLIKIKQFYTKQVLLVASGSVFLSLLSLRFIVNTSWFTQDIFNIIIIFILVYILFRVIKQASQNSTDAEVNSISFLNYFSSGTAGGVIASLSGMGGGVVMVPVLYSVFKLNYKVAKSISLGVIMITAFFMSIENILAQPKFKTEFFHFGYIIPQLSLYLVLGVLIGGALGIKIGQKLSSRTSSIIYSFFLILFIGKKIIELI